MKKLICERCRKETTGCLTMSWFNREMICGKCSEKEKQYKMFNAALMAAEEAERKGDENYIAPIEKSAKLREY